MKRKIIFFVFFVASFIYGTPSTVLIIHPNGHNYKKIENSIEKKLPKNFSVRSIVPNNNSEVRNIFEKNSSQLVVVLDQKLIGLWKELHNEYQRIDVPSIFIGSEIDENLIINNLNNNCTILYRTGLDQYIKKTYQMTGKIPQRIGMIYSYKNLKLIQTIKKDCSRLNVRLFPCAVSVSNAGSSIKSIIKNLIDINKVDLLIIPDDQMVMNPQNLRSIWEAQLNSIALPVAIPPMFLSGISWNNNVFSLQQDYSEIADYAANLINSAHSNNWKITRREIHAYKGIPLVPQNKLKNNFEIQNSITATTKTIDNDDHSTDLKNESVKTPEPSRYHPSDNENNQNDSIMNVASAQQSSKAVGSFAKKAPNQMPVTQTKKSTSSDVKKPEKNSLHNNNASSYSMSSGTSTSGIPTNIKQSETNSTQVSLDKISNVTNVNDNNKIGKHQKIISKAVSVYKKPSAETSVVGITRNGDKITILAEDETWLHVDFFGIPGYILKGEVNFHNQPFVLSNAKFNPIAWLTFILFFIINVTIFILIRRTRKTKSDSLVKTCLLITNNHQKIKYSSTSGKYVPIKKFIKNFGYHVKILKNANSLHSYLEHQTVDFIMVDFSIDHYIRSIVFQTLMEGSFSTQLTLLFFNVTNTAEIKQDFHLVHKTFIYNSNFTISDLNKVLLMTTMNESTSSQTSNPAESYLEGTLQKNTLPEIFLMIDSCKKTGCLLVENEESSAMVFFEEGIITYAISNTMIAEEAVFSVLSQKTGSFRFISDKKPIAQQIYLNVQEVLLERARIEDETTHISIEKLLKHHSPESSTSSDKSSTNGFNNLVNISEFRKVNKVA